MTKDDGTWLNICYVACALVFIYVLWKALHSLGLFSGLLEDYSNVFGPVAGAISVVVGAGVVYYARRQQENHEYYLASIGELRKVTWPTWPDTKKMTVIVVIVVGIFSAILAVFDLGFAWLLNKIIA